MPEAAIYKQICFKVVQLLGQERRRQGVSMEELAKRSGLSKGMVSLVERGLRNPTLDTVVRISIALGMDVSGLLKRATRGVIIPRKG